MTDIKSTVATTKGMNAKGKEMARHIANPNVRAMLKTIARAEFGDSNKKNLYALGFNNRAITDFKKHPFAGSELTPQKISSASGAGQFMGHTWAGLQKEYGFCDFTCVSQDAASVALIKRRGALEDVTSGNVTSKTLDKRAPDWASINKKGAGYYKGQKTPTGEYANMLAYFKQQQAVESKVSIPPGNAPANGALYYSNSVNGGTESPSAPVASAQSKPVTAKPAAKKAAKN